MFTDTRTMSIDVSDFLTNIRKGIQRAGYAWTPMVIQDTPFKAYHLVRGVLWAPQTGLHVFKGICPPRLVDHFLKTHKGIVIVEKEDETVILSERFPGVTRFPKEEKGPVAG